MFLNTLMRLYYRIGLLTGGSVLCINAFNNNQLLEEDRCYAGCFMYGDKVDLGI